jgi:hypothetical protein
MNRADLLQKDFDRVLFFMQYAKNTGVWQANNEIIVARRKISGI